jgi:hypothetical protein
MNRDEVARLVLGARTLGECEAAEAALRQWIERHRDDVSMQEIGEQLAMMKDALSDPEPSSAADPPRQSPGGSPQGLPDRSEADYGLPFDEEVRLVQEELGYDEAAARTFVASYRPVPGAP